MNYKYLFKQIALFIIVGILLFFSFKFVFFYMPFLIAYIFSLLIEPIIKNITNKFGISRKSASIIVLVITFSILIGIISCGIFKLFSEANNLLKGFNQALEMSMSVIQDLFNNIDLNKFPNETKNLIEKTSIEVFNKIAIYIRNLLGNIIEFITRIPSMAIYLIITILATYFISSDKFYILDRMEFHVPHKWMKNLLKKSKSITQTLGGYLKAEIIMIFISFIIVLIGLNIFLFLGINVKYPILMALLIMFVDAMPILGSGSVMVPWATWEFINGNNSLGFSLLGLFVLVLLVKQFLEPKIVSNKIGIHPIFTLIAMYTGFKIWGIGGLLIGPIILIVMKNIFEPFIEEGFFKTIFNID